ncbi:class I SAM-dependent methyltransferase [Bacillus gaemokensis]|uniref:Methyltransferase n=1 Tax=Bacillus gaemokensis TaxID=574375 RepID=A0A073K5Z4_9BACI|nr:class I SAM-dependent methyltransferase [Bacillus gaemokensis]KEK21960.1 methyltransferase [Bacillus gaemokensis]KYG39506.1 methyltransferase [Bacillus gaemokensis]
MNWNDFKVDTYEQEIPLKIPGYFTLYEMLNQFLTTMLLPKEASPHLLIIGAGGGQEIITLGKQNDMLRFTGIDPSDSMLQLAQKRIEREKLQNKISLIKGTVHSILETEVFDAATCMLVLHFIPELTQKKEVLREINKHLKPGAPFFLSLINAVPNTNTFITQMNAWRHHMLQNNIPIEDWNRFETSFGTQIHPISEKDLISTMEECGFIHITRFFTGFLTDGYVAVKQ